MASTSTTRSESPSDIDFSVIRTSIQMGHKMIDQILNGIHYGSEEVRHLLREECDFILECKVCRNLFRSFPNFVAHKRVYCMEYYEEKVGRKDLAPVPVDEETVVIQPEAPEEIKQTNKNDTARPKNSSASNSTLEKVISKTYEGKSKEYQFYTKVAEDVEKRKFTKVTNTVTLTPIAATANAVTVTHAKGDRSGELAQGTSPKKQSPVKSKETSETGSPAIKKNSVLAVCADLAKKKLLQEGNVPANSTANPLPLSRRASARSRKSSPRKSVDYLENEKSGTSKNSKSVSTEEDMDMSEWNEENSSDESKVAHESVSDKEWLKFCDVKNSMCKVCKRTFTSLYNLKFHAKMKHVDSVAQYACPDCDLTFDYSSSVARHLRQKHHKSESYINNIKIKLHNRKRTEEMEVDQDDSSSSSSGAYPSSPNKKETKNMLSSSTGWKKCDKCGKVCWKAKSFYRHYSTCKGPTAKSNSKSATNSPVKTGKPNNSTGLLKLQEKLRAGVIQTSSAENTERNISREKKSESDTKSRDRMPAERNVERSGATSQLLKALTQPLVTDSNETRTTAPSDVKEGQIKTYNLRLSNQANEQEDKVIGNVMKDSNKVDNKEQNDKNKEALANNGSPAFKKLEERLVREAGLVDTQKKEKALEAAAKSYSTRHASLKSSVVEGKDEPETEPKEVTGKTNQSRGDSPQGKEDNLAKVKEQRVLRESPEIKQLEEKLTREAKPYETKHASHVKSIFPEAEESATIETKDNLAKTKEQRILRESPEIKQLEEKLTREALGHKNLVEGKETIKDIQPNVIESSNREVSVKMVESGQTDTNNEAKEPAMTESRKSRRRTTSTETENRKERISEKLREKMASQEFADNERKARSSRSVSLESDTKSDKTPEKLHLMTSLSPVASPSRSSFLPSSPTPSLQSNSGDSYNMKFKMTVQEMAELVESASLTKFAKERKKRARNILNTKQVKESQKVAAGLSKQMKRQYKKRSAIIRNVYGTRNKRPGSTPAEGDNTISRFSGTNLYDEELDNADTSMENRAEVTITSRDSSNEMRPATKRLSREQKRLQNSAGFVEKNFFTISTSRDSSKDRLSDADSEKRRLSRERKRLENSEGFVDKGFLYESDSSVERDRRSISKSIKTNEKADVPNVNKTRIHVEKSADENVENKDNNASISTDIIPGKSISLNEYENMPNEGCKEAKEKHEEMKQTNDELGVKKTVLYVGKDFTEKIKSIQQNRRSDARSETGNTDVLKCGNSESEIEEKSKKKSEKPQVEQLKHSDIPVESKTKQSLSNASVEQDIPREQSFRSVDRKQKSNDSVAQSKVKDSPKHRTRLATGSIFFDSELLKLSPSKAEKKIAELNKTSDTNKGKIEKGGHPDNELTLVKKRLSLSPKKDMVQQVSLHQRTQSGPQRYSLSTGVKQCPKCNRTFWKKKAFVFHLVNSSCSDKKMSKLDRKRALSLSPEGRMLEDNKIGSEIRSNKKVKRDEKPYEKLTGKTVDEDKDSGDISNDSPKRNEEITQKVLRKHVGSSNKSFEQSEADNKEVNVDLTSDKPSNAEDIRSTRTRVSLRRVDDKRCEVSKKDTTLSERMEEDEVSFVKVSKNSPKVIEKSNQKHHVKDDNVRNVITDEDNVRNNGETMLETMGKLRSQGVENIKQTRTSRVQGIDTSKDNEGVSQSEKVKLKSYSADQVSEQANDKVGISDERTKGAQSVKEVNVKSERNQSEPVDFVKKADPKSDSPKVQEDQTNEEVTCKEEQLSDNVTIMDEVPGPSTSMSSVFSEDSDDEGSDFSGFSEDDLKVGEQELSEMDLDVQDDIEDDFEEERSDDDIEEVSDDPEIDDDTGHNLKPDSQSASTSQRPIRKSAQNRFAHVEEIWVYKEPGKPIVEKTKNVQNREYVIDLTNPSKLQCHNSKDVDKLIDEKNLKCRQCETPCTSISNLRRHVIRHLGWKRYKCKHCPYTCYDMSYCRQHVLRAHDENLTNKNFNMYITDLKKEANSLRAAKRTSTLHKAKQNSMDDDTYKKHKTSGTHSTAGQKVNTGQAKSNARPVPVTKSNTNQGPISDVSIKESRKTTDKKNEAAFERKKVDMVDFIGKTEGTKEIHVKKDATPKVEKRFKTEDSPLDRARLSLSKALHEKS